MFRSANLNNQRQRPACPRRRDLSRLRPRVNFPTILLLMVFGFAVSFAYLHQKVGLFVAAYQLTDSHQAYNDLVDKRDYLLYNFSKEVSLPRVNQWAKNNDFFFAGEEKVLALDLKQEEVPVWSSKFASLFKGFRRIPTGASTALANDEE